MRKYDKINQNKLIEVKCNKCGKKIRVKNGIIEEGVFCVNYVWGYFSNKDGEIDSFDLCEDCYDQMTSEFIIPKGNFDNTELL